MKYEPPETFLTRRLLFRPSTICDSDEIFRAYATDPQVTRYLSWRPHKTVEDTREFLNWCNRVRGSGNVFAYVIESRSKADLLGMIEVRVQEHAVEYAYVLKRGAWGDGIMSEALSAFVEDAFSHPAIWRVYALCDTENPASAKVMEKAGMIGEGVRRRHAVYPNLSPEPRDGLIFARVR